LVGVAATNPVRQTAKKSRSANGIYRQGATHAGTNRREILIEMEGGWQFVGDSCGPTATGIRVAPATQSPSAFGNLAVSGVTATK